MVTTTGSQLQCSTTGATVFVFDSCMPACQWVKHQVAAFLATQSKTIKLSFVDVQKKCGEYDCDLFALASATVLVEGINPGRQLRKDLLECLNHKKWRCFWC